MSKRRSSRNQLEALLNRAAEPIFLLNLSRELVFLNPACASVSGLDAEALSGLPCHYHGGGAGAAPDAAARLAPPPEVWEGRPTAVLTGFPSSTGETSWRHVHFFPCHDDAGRVFCAIGLVLESPTPVTSLQAPHIELHEELLRLRDRLLNRYGMDKIVAVSQPMRRVLDQIRLAAQSRANVIVWGESGTGKDLVARTIHQEGDRRTGPFVPVDCGLLAPDILERDLFGSDESAPATGPRAGLLRTARGGTLYLKRVTTLPRDAQCRLADHLPCPRGGPAQKLAQPEPDVRLIASDCADPAHALERGELRPNLYFGLSTLSIELPPLRDRRDDVPLLAQAAVERANARGAKQVSGFSPGALEVLSVYEWPGNVRELEEAAETGHRRCQGILIEAKDLPAGIRGERGGAFTPPPSERRIDLDEVLLRAERKLIELALNKAHGNKSRAAELLSISRPRLYRRMAMLGMEVGDPADNLVGQAEGFVECAGGNSQMDADY